MNNFKLSICIPTFNRSFYLNLFLQEIFKQYDESLRDIIEICISNNKSTDDTDECIRNWKGKGKFIISHYNQEENIGADKNFDFVVNMAGGEYCWIVGDDDLLLDNSLNTLLTELNQGYDIYITNRIACNKKLIPFAINKPLKVKNNKNIFKLNNRGEFLEYLDSGTSLISLFSYLGISIFKKKIWDSVETEEWFLGTNYLHVCKILSFIKKGCVLKYIDKSFLLVRFENDSFASEGKLNRIMIDYQGYLTIAEKLFSNDKEIKLKILSIMLLERNYFRIMFLKIFSDKVEWENMKKIIIKYPYSKDIINVISRTPKILLINLVILNSLLGRIRRKIPIKIKSSLSF